MDIRPIRVSHSLENKQGLAMEKVAAVDESGNIRGQQLFYPEPCLPVPMQAPLPSLQNATSLPRVNQSSQEDLMEATEAFADAGNGAEQNKASRLRNMVINTRASSTYQQQGTSAT